MKKLIVILIFLFPLNTIAQADVMIQRKTTADMAGLMTIESNASEIIKGDKSISSMTSQMTGGMMAKIGGGKIKEAINITRIDRGIYYEIDPEKKVYSETPLASLKEQFSKSQEASTDGARSEYIWTSEIKTSVQKQKINGFDCRNIIGKAIGIKRENPKDSVFIIFDECAANNVPGQTEIEQFQKSYADALGIDEMWSQKNLGQMMKDYGPQIEILAKKIKESGGYPIKTLVNIESTQNSFKEMTGNPNASESSQNGHYRTILMTMEVLSIVQKPADDAQFEVPAGYKKR